MENKERDEVLIQEIIDLENKVSFLTALLIAAVIIIGLLLSKIM